MDEEDSCLVSRTSDGRIQNLSSIGADLYVETADHIILEECDSVFASNDDKDSIVELQSLNCEDNKIHLSSLGSISDIEISCNPGLQSTSYTSDDKHDDRSLQSSILQHSSSATEKPIQIEASVVHSCLWEGCHLLFVKLDDLVSHLTSAHVKLDPNMEYVCMWQGCTRKRKGFNARYKILVHLRIHTNERPHQCQICKKSFTRVENLKIHNRCHTGERPYICPYEGCSKAYSNSSDRFKHVRTHTLQQPYCCKMPGCNKRYTDPSTLRKHVRAHKHYIDRDDARQNDSFKRRGGEIPILPASSRIPQQWMVFSNIEPSVRNSSSGQRVEFSQSNSSVNCAKVAVSSGQETSSKYTDSSCQKLNCFQNANRHDSFKQSDRTYHNLKILTTDSGKIAQPQVISSEFIVVNSRSDVPSLSSDVVKVEKIEQKSIDTLNEATELPGKRKVRTAIRSLLTSRVAHSDSDQNKMNSNTVQSVMKTLFTPVSDSNTANSSVVESSPMFGTLNNNNNNRDEITLRSIMRTMLTSENSNNSSVPSPRSGPESPESATGESLTVQAILKSLHTFMGSSSSSLPSSPLPGMTYLLNSESEDNSLESTVCRQDNEKSALDDKSQEIPLDLTQQLSDDFT